MAAPLRNAATFRTSAAALAVEIGKVQKGTVKWYNNKRGYGFIVPDESVDQDCKFQEFERLYPIGPGSEQGYWLT